MLLYPRVPAIHSPVSTYKFTIDRRPDLWYHSSCYLEETSPTPSFIPALTLDASISCSLLTLFFPLTSFVFNTLRPLFPNAPFASRTDLREHGGYIPQEKNSRSLPLFQISPLATISFRINTCRRISKQRTSTPPLSHSYKNMGGGGDLSFL